MGFEKFDFTIGHCTGAKAPKCSAWEHGANPDIAGVGVLVAFLFPTFLILLLKVTHFLLQPLLPVMYKGHNHNLWLYQIDVQILAWLDGVVQLYVSLLTLIQIFEQYNKCRSANHSICFQESVHGCTTSSLC